jgi:hypothetical protein
MSKPWSPTRQVIRPSLDGISAAIGKDQEGQHLLQILRLLQMQGAEFQVHDQNLRVGFRAHDVARKLEGIEGRVAAHEGDHAALDRRTKPKDGCDLHIQPRRIEAGAGGHNQVGDGVAPVGDTEPADRL